MKDQKKLVVVLGAHRSGTSLCAAAMQYLGANLCLPDDYRNEENSKGFFEHPDFVEFNDALLAHLGGVWDNPIFNGSEALAAQSPVSITPWRKAGVELIRQLFGNKKLCAIKDPRLCQLLDFWHPLFQQAGFAASQLRYVHVLRDPVEVALSQQQRARKNPAYYEVGHQLAEGAALWLSLTAQALHSARSLPTFYLNYRQLMDRPEECLRAIAEFTELEFFPETAREFAQEFVDGKLYRSERSDDGVQRLDKELPQLFEFFTELQPLWESQSAQGVESALNIYRRSDTSERLADIAVPALSRLSIGCRESRLAQLIKSDELESLTRQRDEFASVVQPLRAEVKALEGGLSELNQQHTDLKTAYENIESDHQNILSLLRRSSEENTRLEADCAHLMRERSTLESTIRDIQKSLSWRITQPLRCLRSWQLQLQDSAGGAWRQFRLRAIQNYHRLSIRHPSLAWNLRRLLRPVFRGIGRLLDKSSQSSERFNRVSGNLLEPLLYQQYETNEAYAPLISVIVPNYNHAEFLTLRLDSIYSQSYPNIEVILLDDASTDDSVSILEDYQRRYSSNTRLICNEKNSGGVFHQWQRGLEAANSDIVWIAESDDWCSDNFLESLVPYFENEAVQLAYARTVFMDGDGDEQIWSINEYLHDIDPERWNSEILTTGANIVREAFAQKNIIPNVSSAIFRNPRSLEIMHDPKWETMRICGDWVLYLHLLRGGMLAYSPVACNYYRIHGQNTSVSAYADDAFYREHELVAETLIKYFGLDKNALEQLRENLIIHWRQTRPNDPVEGLDICFSLNDIRKRVGSRSPNLLMASYAFCAGGGETFPVSLANLMKAQGYNVTYLDCAQEERNEGVRKRLRPDIPVVSDYSQIERIVQDFNIDIIHSHHAWVDSTVLDVLPEKSFCKTVVTLHGMYETINEVDLKGILPRLVKRTARLIYVAEKNLGAIDSLGLRQQARLQRIDNALEHEAYVPVTRGALQIPDSAFILTLVSRGMEEKGWAEGIQAVALARELSGNDIHLVLVGDGPEYERLKSEKLPAFVHLEGFQSNVRGYFAVADLGFLPSRFKGESFPLVIIECLQVGRPMMATNIGEISYMLESQEGLAGVLLELDGDDLDIEAMAQAIAEVSEQSEIYEGLVRRVPIAANKFDPVILAAKHDETYRAALAE
ncbi:glycosyltransferase [Parahaliea sp. F7430]|uniref:Glycosyltransferase n=1 Tax=Sediminihaliea albiluteola TaxID=2758564 RepID=A0A7W2TYG5_9GAMM|nr:glycosyltransferase [Sediminihaliea albiluteola]MBA6414279.1 glycosyltransferase [Sediminihaliea albiluteola]